MNEPVVNRYRFHDTFIDNKHHEMKLSLLILCSVWIVALHHEVRSCQALEVSDSDETDEEDSPALVAKHDNDNDGIYQRNPNYETIDSVLGRNATAIETSVRSVARYLKKHRFVMLLCFGFYVIHRFVPLQHLVKPLYRGKFDADGTLVGTHWTSTDISRMLQLGTVLILLLYTTSSKMEEEDESSSLLTTMLLGPKTGFAAVALRRMLRPNKEPYNPAYIPSTQQHYTFELLNDRYSKDAKAMAKVTKNQHSSNTCTALNAKTSNATIVVLDWTGLDVSVSNLDTLKDSVSFLLSLDDSKFDIVVVLESPGGSAARYAMAAQQLCRLRQNHDITICVDTVAASGGYMIACVGTRIIASPFAMLGSIGVVGQSVNVHKVLENWGIRPLVFRGGRDKAPLGLIGEVTDENLAKMQGLIDDTHRAFKRHVVENRPRLTDTIEEIATGDVWFGYDAVEVGLIDSIGTSDEYLLSRMKAGARVLKLRKIVRKGLFGAPTTAESLTKASTQGIPERILSHASKALIGHNFWKQVTVLTTKLSMA